MNRLLVFLTLLITIILFSSLAYTAQSLPKVKIAYDANGNAIYIGKSTPGSSEDLTPSGFFQIRKVTYDANNNPTDIKWADGNAKYDNSWINRTNLTYE